MTECKVCLGLFSIPDPLDRGELADDLLEGETGKKYVACPACSIQTSALGELKCPYCLEPQDPDSWRPQVPRKAVIWEGQNRLREFKCMFCSRLFGWSYDVVLSTTSRQVDLPDVDPLSSTLSEKRRAFSEDVSQTILEEKFPSTTEQSTISDLSMSSALFVTRWGVVVPLPLHPTEAKNVDTIAKRMGCDKESAELAKAFSVLFGPCKVLTSERAENFWLRFLENRESMRWMTGPSNGSEKP